MGPGRHGVVAHGISVLRKWYLRPLLHLDRFWGIDSRVPSWLFPPTSLTCGLPGTLWLFGDFPNSAFCQKTQRLSAAFLTRSFCSCLFLSFHKTLHILLPDTYICVHKHIQAHTCFYLNIHSDTYTCMYVPGCWPREDKQLVSFTNSYIPITYHNQCLAHNQCSINVH